MTVRGRYGLRGRRGTAGVTAALLLALSGAGCTGAADTARSQDDAPKEPSASGSPQPGGKQLDSLEVRRPGTMDGYARDRFPHWSTQQGACDTREAVLKRDGEDVRTDDECRAVSGRWHSPFDGEEWTESSDVDVDHVVPLAEAWRSGARGWDDERREAFANDVDRPQLLAVTDNVNQSKGDSPPDDWKPPLKSYWCTYARDWVTVKAHYELSVTEDEKTALRGMLDRCDP